MSGGPPKGRSGFPRVDLHIHSVFSDGEFTPTELAGLSREAGLVAQALTDHDCMDGLPEFRAAAEGFEPIDGVEISARKDEVDVHVIGLFVDPRDQGLIDRLAGLITARAERARAIVRKLRALGVAITDEEVNRFSEHGSIGRPHVARALVEAGVTRSVEEAFHKYLRPHRPAFVPSPGPSPEEACGWILEAGGTPVLAHPGIARHDEWIPGLVDAGLAGLEVWHPKHNARQRAHYLKKARDLDLVPTGGSDYHGSSVGDAQVGQEPVPAESVERLRARRPRR